MATSRKVQPKAEPIGGQQTISELWIVRYALKYPLVGYAVGVCAIALLMATALRVYGGLRELIVAVVSMILLAVLFESINARRKSLLLSVSKGLLAAVVPLALAEALGLHPIEAIRSFITNSESQQALTPLPTAAVSAATAERTWMTPVDSVPIASASASVALPKPHGPTHSIGSAEHASKLTSPCGEHRNTKGALSAAFDAAFRNATEEKRRTLSAGPFTLSGLLDKTGHFTNVSGIPGFSEAIEAVSVTAASECMPVQVVGVTVTPPR